jgi:hypothetical protein
MSVINFNFYYDGQNIISYFIFRQSKVIYIQGSDKT